MELAVSKNQLGLPATLASKLSKQHAELVIARNNGKGMDTPEQFRQCVGYVIALCGINKIPNVDESSILLQIFSKKFGGKINYDEFRIAFEQNMNGELENYLQDKTKVEHFQMFSSEFMCDVLNAFTKKRALATINYEKLVDEAKLNALPPVIENPFLIMLEEILSEVNKVENLRLKCTPQMKLEALHEIFSIEPSEELVIEFRKKATQEILRRLRKEKSEANRDEKFGVEINLLNQIARLQAGHGLTNNDEATIQNETTKLLYYHYVQFMDKEMLKTGLVENIENIKAGK